MKLRYKIIITTLFLAFATILPYSIKSFHNSVFAQEAQTVDDLIRVSPFILNLDLKPNLKEEHKITIENLTDTPLPLRINPGFFDAYDETGKYIFPEKEPERSLARWLSIDNRELILPAKGKGIVTLTITTPAKIPEGGYYGMLFIDPIIAPQQGGSIMQTRVGVLLLANIGDPELMPPPIQYSNLDLPWLCGDLTGTQTTFSVRNRSIFHIAAKPFIGIKPLFGNSSSVAIEDRVLFPGRSRIWENVTIKCPNIPGIYTLSLNTSYGEGQQILTEKKLIVLPYQYVLIGLLIFVLLNGIFLRKRLMKVGRILFGRQND